MTKKMFFDALNANAVAVFHGLSEWTAYMKRNCKAKKIVNVGERAHNHVRITNVVTSAQGSTYSLNLGNELMQISTPMLGRFNVFNTALCATMAHAFGVPRQGIVDALSLARGPKGRMERYDLQNGAVAVIDYAHSPDALYNALSVLRELLVEGGRLSVVFGCGGNRDKGKRPDMGRIAVELADLIWLTNDNPRYEDPTVIVQNIMGGIEGNTKPVSVELDREKAITMALDNARASDIVLIAGKGHEEVQIIGDERIEFSDSQVVRRYVKGTE
jgi:UDP-N-acetylmuramoyl-L-alanyl-D-glutamate--2,6-diaminopimelate ligase